MTEKASSHAEWFALYQAAMQVKAMAPWEWMSEDDLFGVQHPTIDEIGFVSVMGSLGEHYAVAVYLGPKGLYGFWGLHENEPKLVAEDLFKIPQLQASFEDRNELTKQDRDLIKELGLKFRGRQAWPMFRSIRPGYFPWYLESAEAQLLTSALTQVLDVAPRFKENPDLLTPGDDDAYLVRIQQEEADGMVWSDTIMTVALPPPESISIAMDLEALEQLKQAAPGHGRMEIDLFMLPAQIGEQGTRPYYTYVLLIVDAASGMILGNDLLQPTPTLEAMYGLIPMTVVRQLAHIGIVPAEIHVRSPILAQLLPLLEQNLGFTVGHVPFLPQLEAVKAFLSQRF